ncbi:MAG: hypothetical protein WC028_25705 [Candidatus Obscuribacterales bacterium]
MLRSDAGEKQAPAAVNTLKGIIMGTPVLNPNDNHYYQAESAEDAYFIGRGRIDLVPGTFQVAPPALARKEEPIDFGTMAPNGHYYYAESAEDAYFISRGRTDLVPGCRMR